jgi:hypothetical protein
MKHQILKENTKYSLEITVKAKGGIIKITDHSLTKWEERKEYRKDEVLQIINDLKERSKSTGMHGEIIISEVIKSYDFVMDTYKEDPKDKDAEEIHYMALRLVPIDFKEIDKYKF